MATKKKSSTESKDVETKEAKKAKAKAAPKAEASAAKSTKPKEKTEKSATSKTARRVPLNVGTVFATHGALCQWSLVDAKDVPLGRLSSFVASLLMGKTKASYTRHADTGDFVVVINAKDVVLTGKKWEDKTYYWHTNYPGGIKSVTARQLRETHPDRLIEWAVSGMLPKGHMGRRWLKKLRIFAGADHPHQAQKPQVVKLPNVGNIGERA